MFASPLGFLALLSVPAILVLHLYRRKFQPRIVSALFLWSDESATPISGRKRERLPKSLSLACELLAAVCLSVCLAGPRGCGTEGGEHLVVVVDGSASMGARLASGARVVELVRSAVAERIDGLANGSSVTLVQSGARPNVIAGPAAFPAEAKSKLVRYEPTALHHDLASSLELARQIAGGARVVCFTDRVEGLEFAPDVEVVALGAESDNTAIVRATRTSGFGASAGKDTIEVTLASFARADGEVRVTAVLPLSDGAPVIAPQSLRLAAAERKTWKFEVARGTGPVEVRLDPDALSIDDTAWLAPPPRRTVALRAALNDEHAQRLGLASKERGPIGRWLELVLDATEAASDDAAHVLITDRASGGPATWTIALAPLGTERRDFIGPFLVDKRHPLLEGVTLEGLVWSTDPTLALTGAPLVSAGNLPLFTEDHVSGKRVFTLALDPARSSLQRSLDWPIVLSNVVEMRRTELPGPSATNIQVDDEITWRAGEVGETVLKLAGPRSEREFRERPVIALDAFEEPGLYTLSRGGSAQAHFGVNFSDAAESDLSQRGTGEHPALVGAASARPTTSRIEMALIAIAVAALLVDWWALGRNAPRFTAARAAPSA